ncbi:hypothetical protein CYMTET_16570, partial [Cymbomonas tetramitiformis]
MVKYLSRLSQSLPRFGLQGRRGRDDWSPGSTQVADTESQLNSLAETRWAQICAEALEELEQAAVEPPTPPNDAALGVAEEAPSLLSWLLPRMTATSSSTLESRAGNGRGVCDTSLNASEAPMASPAPASGEVEVAAEQLWGRLRSEALAELAQEASSSSRWSLAKLPRWLGGASSTQANAAPVEPVEAVGQKEPVEAAGQKEPVEAVGQEPVELVGQKEAVEVAEHKELLESMEVAAPGDEGGSRPSGARAQGGSALAVQMQRGSGGSARLRESHSSLEQSGASPEQAMALAEGGVATLMGASRRVAGLLGGLMAWGGLMRMTGEMWGGPRVELTHAGPLRARGAILAAMTTYNRLHGSIRHLISFRAHRARLLAVPELTALGRVGGSGVVPNVGLVVKRWLEWRRLGSGDMARAARGAGMNRLQAHGSSAPAAMFLAEEGVANFMGVSMRVTQLLEGAVFVGTEELVGRLAGRRGAGGGGIEHTLGGGEMARASWGVEVNQLQRCYAPQQLMQAANGVKRAGEKVAGAFVSLGTGAALGGPAGIAAALVGQAVCVGSSVIKGIRNKHEEPAGNLAEGSMAAASGASPASTSSLTPRGKKFGSSPSLFPSSEVAEAPRERCASDPSVLEPAKTQPRPRSAPGSQVAWKGSLSAGLGGALIAGPHGAALGILAHHLYKASEAEIHAFVRNKLMPKEHGLVLDEIGRLSQQFSEAAGLQQHKHPASFPPQPASPITPGTGEYRELMGAKRMGTLGDAMFFFQHACAAYGYRSLLANGWAPPDLAAAGTGNSSPSSGDRAPSMTRMRRASSHESMVNAEGTGNFMRWEWEAVMGEAKPSPAVERAAIAHHT